MLVMLVWIDMNREYFIILILNTIIISVDLAAMAYIHTKKKGKKKILTPLICDQLRIQTNLKLVQSYLDYLW